MYVSYSQTTLSLHTIMISKTDPWACFYAVTVTVSVYACIFLPCANVHIDHAALHHVSPEKLGPDHLRMVLQMGRNVGCSAGINWLLRDLQYEDSREVAKEDKKAMLQRDYIAAVKQLAQLSREIEAVA